jgi:glycosyltransferase involved in cell wall biosynthesis
MNLALITHKFARGDGQGRVNYEIAKAALAEGHVVWLVASEIAPELAAHSRARTVVIDVNGWPSALLKNQVFAIRSTWWLGRNRHQLDLVHVNGFLTWGRADVNTSHFVHSAWLESRYHTARVRRDAYGAYQYLYSYCGSLLERWAYRRSNIVVGVSEQVRRELLDSGVDEGRLRVIANGVDLDEFAPATVSRRELGLPPGMLLLFVGDIKTPRKNLDTLLRALARVRDATLVVVGSTSSSSYPAMARQLGLAERVLFLGYRRDIPQLMRAADLFVFPSRYEACSLVLLEAAASGLPIVAARSTGGTELLTPACSVLVNDPDDDGELAAVLNELLASPARVRHMGRAARTVAEAHSWQAMAARYLEIYRELGVRRAGLLVPECR